MIPSWPLPASWRAARSLAFHWLASLLEPLESYPGFYFFLSSFKNLKIQIELFFFSIPIALAETCSAFLDPGHKI
jgi:hypothetical protein